MADKKENDEMSTQQQQTLISKKALPFFLASTAGWFDVVCMQHYKCYSNMVRQNDWQFFNHCWLVEACFARSL